MMHALPDLVRGLSPDDAREVLALGEPLAIAGGSVLFRLGDHADALYLVERGSIALRLPMDVGGVPREVVVEEREVGQTVGWSGFIPPHRFTLEAVAVVDTDVLVLRRDRLRRHFDARPAVGWAVTENLASVVGQRLQVIQAMWLREVQRLVQLRFA